MTAHKVLVNEFWHHEAKGMMGRGVFNDFINGDDAGDSSCNSIEIGLGKEVNKKIKDLCKNSPVLVYNFYSTVFSILLDKYFSVHEICFISPYSQFEKNADDNFFLFKSVTDTNRSFKEIFSANKAFLARSLDNCLPLSEIRNTANGIEELGLLVGDDRELYKDNSPELLFCINERADDCYLRIGFSATRFHENKLELFGYSFKKLLDDVLQKIYEPVGNLNFRSEIEQQLLNEFNSVETYFPLQENVVELITQQAQLTPTKIAIRYNEQVMDYRRLNEMSNQFAHYLLHNYPVKPDMLLGVMMDRSVTMAVCILAIWKTGAAYVPIDKNYPADRIRQIIRHSGLIALLVDDTVPGDQINRMELTVPVVNMDTVEKELSSLSSLPVNIKIGAGDLAYVIYTSGSTGEPKGVMIEHLGMINHIGSKVVEMGINQESNVAQNAVHTFDISVWQLFSTLITGGTTVIYDNDVVMNPTDFMSKVDTDEISVLELVPSYLVEMLSVLEQKPFAFSALRILILNAETLMPAMVKRWLALYPHIPIVNTYGATEASDDISHYIMYDCPAIATVPVLKRPIQNVEVHIVNDRMQLVPIGVKGEIVLAGPGIGRGYLNDKERTTAAFLKGPISGITNRDRIYKTGDLGRYLPDGTMEFLGRKDTQVKIRGNRVELGEIEHALMNINGIEHAAVVANMEEHYLVAYYQSGNSLAKEQLQNALREKLPAYMVPHYYIQLDKFPLTPNGKIDRKNLPDVEAAETTITYIAPRNETEEKLALAWQEILGKERVGVKDDFFDLGGHSLKVTRLVAQVHKLFDVKVTVKELFTTTVLEEQAQLIGKAGRKAFISIPVAPVLNGYPLSPAQQRMWVLSQLEDGSIAYNMPAVFVFDGELDTDAMEYAFNTLVARHESLRTIFRENEQGDVMQSVGEKVAEIKYCDLSAEEDPQQAVKILLQNDFVAPFDLGSGPLLRAGLYKIAAGKHVFMYVLHHIISDGWSMDVLVRELALLYNNFHKQATDPLAPLRIQYKDYTVWLQQQLQGESLEIHKTYWLNQLGGEIPVLELPSDNLRPAVKTYNGKQLTTTIDAHLVKGIRSLAQEQGATLFMSLLAAVNTILYRYTGQEDIIIGSPVAGREHADLEDQIGLYVNTLALRTQFKGEDSFKELLARVKEMTLGAYEHQVYPFDELIDELNLQRDVSRNPLFEVMVVLQNTGHNANIKEQYLGKVKVDGFDTGEDLISKFDLLFDFVETGDTIQARIQYNSDIYSRSSIERLARHFEQLLSAVIADPSIPIGLLDYLDEEEKEQLLNGFNDTAAVYPKDKTMVNLFEERVVKTPDKVALEFQSSSFTYQQLNERANRFAAYLRQQYNIQPDDLIGVKLERSEWMILSILAILKAGGAYVPIDPAYPQERIDYIMTDSKCKVLIDDEELEVFRSSEDNYSKANPTTVNKPSDLIYVIYTSGSTGRPKGCMLEHRGIVNRLEWMWQQYEYSESDIILQKTTFTFDVSVWELFMPLCWGAKMVLCEKEDTGSPERIVSLIEKHKVSCLHFVPSMLSAFIGAAFEEKQIADRLKSLRLVITSGEALPVETVKTWYDKLDVPIHNLYGPTEASVDVSYYATSKNDSKILIGEPVWNTQLYIIGPAGQLQPVGIAGEICIGGDGLARGYLNKEELTAEKFTTNPFTGKKMYRTGDTGRWNADGKIEYIGRKDSQVKIRGYRIELGEIESALQSHPDISSCAVIAKTTASGGEKELVAYIVTRGSLNTMDLRSWLGKTLPAYMIPGHYVEMEILPLTGSGKLDRKALPDIATGLRTGVEYIAARNETEEKLVAIWQEVLGKEKIGVEDNFFDAGGNSIRIIKMVRLLNKLFNRKISVITAFKFPTIITLAEYMSADKEIEERESEEEMMDAVKIMEGTFDSLNYVDDEK